jgi:hypothetical protein
VCVCVCARARVERCDRDNSMLTDTHTHTPSSFNACVDGQVHRGFLKLIESEMESKTGRMISDAFINSIECLRLYGEYCCKMPAAIDACVHYTTHRLQTAMWL